MEAALLNVNCGALVLIVLCILELLHAYDADDYALMELQVDENVTRKTAQVLVSTAALFDYR
jgi:fumarate reductase subunit D